MSPEPPEEEETFIPKNHPIGIRNAGGKAEFYNKMKSESFIPRGVNYFYIVSTPDGFLQDRFFGIGEFDESRVRSDFQELTDHGYNVVRIFLDTCTLDFCSKHLLKQDFLFPLHLPYVLVDTRETIENLRVHFLNNIARINR